MRVSLLQQASCEITPADPLHVVHWSHQSPAVLSIGMRALQAL